MSAYEADLGGKLLSSVSRSFYLTLKALPSELREPISLAYLLARTADTLADTAEISAPIRLSCLQRFGELVQADEPQNATDLTSLAATLRSDFCPHQTDAAEATLMQRLPEAIAWLGTMRGAALAAIRSVLKPIIHGQCLDIERFPGNSQSDTGSQPAPTKRDTGCQPVPTSSIPSSIPSSAPQTKIQSLTSSTELDEYTWLVAGCVGEFWTKLCFSELPAANPAFIAGVTEEQACTWGTCYGKGLQLVNILRDISKDARLGRCYLPSEEWQLTGLKLEDIQRDPLLLWPTAQPWLTHCAQHLEQGLQYVQSLAHSKLRYATALPLLLGVRTLAKLRQATPDELRAGVKVSRLEVGKILFDTTLANNAEGIAKLYRKLA